VRNVASLAALFSSTPPPLPPQRGRGVVAPPVYKYLTPSKPWQQGQQGFHLRMSELGHSEEGQPCMPCARTQVLIVFACIAVESTPSPYASPHRGRGVEHVTEEVYYEQCGSRVRGMGDGDHNLILLSPPPLTSFEPSGAIKLWSPAFDVSSHLARSSCGRRQCLNTLEPQSRRVSHVRGLARRPLKINTRHAPPWVGSRSPLGWWLGLHKLSPWSLDSQTKGTREKRAPPCVKVPGSSRVPNGPRLVVSRSTCPWTWRGHWSCS
jgi:hypothetical protein